MFYYLEAKSDNNLRFCWDSTPGYHCPVAQLTVDDLGLIQAAQALGVTPGWLERRVKHNPVRERAANGKLTETCVYCGHKLERLGFRCWVERRTTDPAKLRIMGRIGGFMGEKIDGPWYRKTKKEAQDWASIRSDEA
jgi:hypothetical protein